MKNYLSTLLLLLCLLVCLPKSYAQILKRIEKKIQQKVNHRIEKKTDNVIENVLNKVERGIDGTSLDQDSSSTMRSKSSIFDFIPGDHVLFLDAFEQEAKGDFPARWNTNGSGELVTIQHLIGNWLKIPDNSISFPELKTALPENFTIEFDLYYPQGTTRPPITFGFTELANPAKSSIQHKKLFYFHIPSTIKNNIGYSTSLYSGREITQSWPANKMAGRIVHVSIAVQNTRIRLYMDENKIFDLPKAFDSNRLRNNFHFRAAPIIPEAKYGFYVSNLRIAEAGVDARSQLINTGKYSTTGIFFEVGSASIKPQSFGILKEMADILLDQSNLQLKIIGHTDTDGSQELNVELSRKRAAAVKTILEKEYNIDAKRLIIEGKGASEPVTQNHTLEGKASNRRVEFIKQ